MEEGLLQDTHFWVFLASLGFFAALFKFARKPLLAFLDARTVKIKADLDEAEKLRNEAQELLAESQRKHRDAIQTAQKIIDNARDTAARVQKEAEQKLVDSLKRREEQLLGRIRQAEAAAVNDLRRQAADLATKSAEILLHDALGKRGGKLVDEAIGDIPASLG